MTFLTTIFSHWSTILIAIASIHAIAEVVAPIINKPGYTSGLAKAFAFIAPALGVATKIAEQQAPTVTTAVTALTGDAAKLAAGTAL